MSVRLQVRFCHQPKRIAQFITMKRQSNHYRNIIQIVNQGVCSINLPYVALEAIQDNKGDLIETFFNKLDHYLEVCHKGLQWRHNNLLGSKSDVAPILWQNGAYARLKPNEVIDPLLFNDYSSISLGYAGLFECVKALTGKSHTEEKEFALSIMQKLNDKCNEWKANENIGYSVYGTPKHSLGGIEVIL